MLVFVNVPFVTVALGLAAVMDVVVVCWLAGQQTILQTNVDDGYLGQAFGAFATTNALTLLLGTLLAGALADLAGVVPLLDLFALFYAAGCLALLAYRSGRKARA